jgi:septal ring factor EnvC (AmiA/AmiB activator)
VVVSGDGTKMVMVKHGDYFTVYANLANTMVSANQQVAAGTAIGGVGEDFDGTFTLDFQIWNGGTPVDPLGWIN